MCKRGVCVSVLCKCFVCYIVMKCVNVTQWTKIYGITRHKRTQFFCVLICNCVGLICTLQFLLYDIYWSHKFFKKITPQTSSVRRCHQMVSEHIKMFTWEIYTCRRRLITLCEIKTPANRMVWARNIHAGCANVWEMLTSEVEINIKIQTGNRTNWEKQILWLKWHDAVLWFKLFSGAFLILYTVHTGQTGILLHKYLNCDYDGAQILCALFISDSLHFLTLTFSTCCCCCCLIFFSFRINKRLTIISSS